MATASQATACCTNADAISGNRGSDGYRAEYGDAFVFHWDDLIGWSARAASEGSFFVDILRNAGAHRVLDAACGTGFHAVQLALAGFTMTASDGATAMVAQTEANLRAHGVEGRCMVADWRDLAQHVDAPYDAILCLGNSFAHLFTAADRQQALAQFFGALRPGGVLVLDHRNYDAILDGGGECGCRQSYCCVGDGTSVSLGRESDGTVRITYLMDGAESYSILTNPVRRHEVSGLLDEAGFARPRTFGDFRALFDPARVEFFIQVARRPGR